MQVLSFKVSITCRQNRSHHWFHNPYNEGSKDVHGLFSLLNLIYSHNKEMVENMIYVKQSLFCVSEVANVFCQLLIEKK